MNFTPLFPRPRPTASQADFGLVAPVGTKWPSDVPVGTIRAKPLAAKFFDSRYGTATGSAALVDRNGASAFGPNRTQSKKPIAAGWRGTDLLVMERSIWMTFKVVVLQVGPIDGDSESISRGGVRHGLELPW